MIRQYTIILLTAGLFASSLFLEGSSNSEITLVNSGRSLGENKRQILKLFTAGGDLNDPQNNYPSQILQSDLSGKEKKELLLYLFDYGYSPNSIGKDGNTLLHQVSADKKISLETKLELIKAVVKRGGNIYLENVTGDVPLFSAINSQIDAEQKLAITVLYIQLGFDTNYSNNRGQTLLHQFSKMDHFPLKVRTKAINSLILHGADTNLVDDNGYSPLELLRNCHMNRGDKEMVVQSYLYNEELNFRKLLANSYGITGTTELMGNQIVLDGLYPSQSQSFINLRTRRFYESLKRNVFNEKSDTWKLILNKLSPDAKKMLQKYPEEKRLVLIKIFDRLVEAHIHSLRYLHQPAKTTAKRIVDGDLLAMKVIGVDHLYGVVCYNGILYLCNKGRRNTSFPGIYSYQVNKKDQLELVIKSFKNQKAFDQAIQYQYTGFSGTSSNLQMLLGSGTPQQVLKQKSQKSGNCAIASSNSMELLMLYLMFLEEGGLPAEELARAIKSVHAKQRRLSYVKEYLEWHQNEGKNYPVDTQLLIKISKKKTSDLELDRQYKQMIIDWVTSSDQDPKICKELIETII